MLKEFMKINPRKLLRKASRIKSRNGAPFQRNA